METKEFNPADYIEKIGQGANAYEYLPVEARVIWLRHAAPEASIESEMIHFDGETVIFKATVKRPDLDVISIAHAMKTRKSFDKQGKETVDKEWFQKAESKALGRALANLGFGTENVDDEREGDDHPPVASSQNPSSNPAPKRMTQNQADYLKQLKAEIGEKPVEDETARLNLDKKTMTEAQARALIESIEKKYPAQPATE